jgi:hypothetical protein
MASTTPRPATDEAATIECAAAALVEVIRREGEGQRLRDAVGALDGHVRWLLARRRFAAVSAILASVRSLTTPAGTAPSEAARALLRGLAAGPILEILLSTLWETRHGIASGEIYPCLEALAAELVAPLVHALGAEPRAHMRALLCDLIVLLCRDRVDDIGQHVTDAHWYLARNIAGILGRLDHPGAILYLRRLLRHPEYRVRREAVDALARMSAEDAQTLLATCVDDPDPRVSQRALASLTAAGVRRALPRILALLDRRDAFNTRYEVSRAALEALHRHADGEALPVLRRLARRRLAVGWRGRELRRLAAAAAALCEQALPERDVAAMALRRQA